MSDYKDSDRHELIEIIQLQEQRLDLESKSIRELIEIVAFLEDKNRPRSFEITQVS